MTGISIGLISIFIRLTIMSEIFWQFFVLGIITTIFCFFEFYEFFKRTKKVLEKFKENANGHICGVAETGISIRELKSLINPELSENSNEYDNSGDLLKESNSSLEFRKY